MSDEFDGKATVTIPGYQADMMRISRSLNLIPDGTSLEDAPKLAFRLTMDCGGSEVAGWLAESIVRAMIKVRTR